MHGPFGEDGEGSRTRPVSRLATLGAGLLLGWIAGVWDGAAILLENPRSFTGGVDATGFLAGAAAMSTLAGGTVGALLALLPRRPGIRWFSLGLGLWAFAWLGVRVHVKWFFGAPLTDPVYAAANAALLLGCAAGAYALHRAWGGRAGRALESPWIPGVAALTGLAAAALLGSAPGRSAEPRREAAAPEGARDVLLITWDTTRADHLSGYGYPRGTTPALDRLARGGALWTDLWAPIPLTNPSHSSLFTGRVPRDHGVRNNGTRLPDDVPTVVEDLSEQGWNCAAFVSGIPLKAGLSGLAPGFAVYDDAFSPLERLHPMFTTLAAVRVGNRILPMDFIERRATETAEAAIDWLEAASGPRFLWVHFFDPHTPYDAPAEFRDRFASPHEPWAARGVPLSEWPFADYDAELRATDAAMNRLVRAFAGVSRGQGVVLLTADHGEGLGQHGELAHGTQLFAEDLRVPGIVRGMEGVRGIQTGLATTTGFERLMRIAAGTNEPAAGDGAADAWLRADRVLLETFAPEGRQDQSAVLHASGRKLFVNWETGEERAFDLAQDPGETTPRAVDEIASDLREFLTTPSDEGSVPLDPEVVRRLRALGYLH